MWRPHYFTIWGLGLELVMALMASPLWGLSLHSRGQTDKYKTLWHLDMDMEVWHLVKDSMALEHALWQLDMTLWHFVMALWHMFMTVWHMFMTIWRLQGASLFIKLWVFGWESSSGTFQSNKRLNAKHFLNIFGLAWPWDPRGPWTYYKFVQSSLMIDLWMEECPILMIFSYFSWKWWWSPAQD